MSGDCTIMSIYGNVKNAKKKRLLSPLNNLNLSATNNSEEEDEIDRPKQGDHNVDFDDLIVKIS